MAPWEDYLKTIYYDPSHPASYAGPQKLYKVVQREGKYNIGMHKIRKFLHNQESYSLHKPLRRRFQRNHVVSAGTDDLWMADLMDMVKYAKWNRGYKWVCLVIDTFSKEIWLRAMKTKAAEEVAKAFQDIFTTSGRSPARLVTDRGQEFRAKKVQTVMKEYRIKYLPSYNTDTKASTAERAILTIKTKLNRYFIHKEDYAYLRVLQSMADSYNHTYHRTIDMAPADVNEDNQETVRLSTYFTQSKNNGKLKPFKYKIGDYVRISHLKHVFTRAYDETYTGEVFIVVRRYHRGTLPIYRLKDMDNEEIKGTFYQSELQKIDIKPNQVWKIERVLKTTGKGRNKRLYVKWKNFPSKFNSFIKAIDIQ